MSHKCWVCDCTAVCACCLGVCVNHRAVREACIYRNTWVHFRYLVGVVDYLAEDSTAHVLFSLINFCCFIKVFFVVVAVIYCLIFANLFRSKQVRDVEVSKDKLLVSRSRWSRVVLVVAASLHFMCGGMSGSWLQLNTIMCAPNVYHEAFVISRHCGIECL